MKNKIWIVGIGPGEEAQMTGQALSVLEQVEVIVGYTVYLELLGERFMEKIMLSTPMRQEERRCRLCFEQADAGHSVAMICSGDAGVYGMASLMYEIGREYPDIELEVVPGVTAANSGAALLGAPLNHDYCVISLSDLLTPWELIEKRLIMAARGDFVIALYNPASYRRADYLEKACKIIEREAESDRACGYVENIGRKDSKMKVCLLSELRKTKVTMFTTVFIGNTKTKIIQGKLVTPRGYQVERQ